MTLHALPGINYPRVSSGIPLEVNVAGRGVRLASLALCVLTVACGGTGGVVAGDPDTHCGETVQTIDPATCYALSEAAAEGDSADEYGATLYNSDGQDDECKYHVTFTSSTVERNKDVTFTVSAWELDGGDSVAGAAIRAEIFLNDTHPAPNTDVKTVESPAGTYTIGPVQFDQKGRWTVRFHLFEDCADGAASPHGHVAFYVDVP